MRPEEERPRATLRETGRLRLADLSPPSVEGAIRRHRLGPSYRVCALLALAHALAVTVSGGIVWFVRAEVCCAGWGSDWGRLWVWTVLAWPLWWAPGISFAHSRGRAVLRPWVAATAAWAFAGVPLLATTWSLGHLPL